MSDETLRVYAVGSTRDAALADAAYQAACYFGAIHVTFYETGIFAEVVSRDESGWPTSYKVDVEYRR